MLRETAFLKNTSHNCETKCVAGLSEQLGRVYKAHNIYIYIYIYIYITIMCS